MRVLKGVLDHLQVGIVQLDTPVWIMLLRASGHGRRFFVQGDSAERALKLLHFLKLLINAHFHRQLVLDLGEHIGLLADAIGHQVVQVLVPPDLALTDIIGDEASFADDLCRFAGRIRLCLHLVVVVD